MLYVLEGLLTDVILRMDLLKRYSPSISCVDSVVGVHCLLENDGVCKPILNLQGNHVDGVGHAKTTTCSNGTLCKNKVLASAMYIVESIKVNVVSSKAFVNMVCGDSECENSVTMQLRCVVR